MTKLNKTLAFFLIPYLILTLALILGYLLRDLVYVVGFLIFGYLFNTVVGIGITYVYIIFTIIQVTRTYKAVKNENNNSLQHPSTLVLGGLLILFIGATVAFTYNGVIIRIESAVTQFTRTSAAVNLVEYNNKPLPNDVYEFSYELDVSGLKDGDYKLIVELINQNNQTSLEYLPRKQISIQVENNTYTVKNVPIGGDFGLVNETTDSVHEGDVLPITDSFQYTLYKNDWRDRYPNHLHVKLEFCGSDCFYDRPDLVNKEIPVDLSW